MSTFPAEQEIEPYRGLRALHNADLHSRAPSYAPRQEWLIVRWPAGNGGWDEDHLTATERAAAQLVHDAEERQHAAETQAATATGYLRCLAEQAGVSAAVPLVDLVRELSAVLEHTTKGPTP